MLQDCVAYEELENDGLFSEIAVLSWIETRPSRGVFMSMRCAQPDRVRSPPFYHTVLQGCLVRYASQLHAASLHSHRRKCIQGMRSTGSLY
jgi:hypothetical protein